MVHLQGKLLLWQCILPPQYGRGAIFGAHVVGFGFFFDDQWPSSRSLATTNEVLVNFLSFCYLDVSVHKVIHGYGFPIGSPRVTVALTVAFRPVERPFFLCQGIRPMLTINSWLMSFF